MEKTSRLKHGDNNQSWRQTLKHDQTDFMSVSRTAGKHFYLYFSVFDVFDCAGMNTNARRDLSPLFHVLKMELIKML